MLEKNQVGGLIGTVSTVTHYTAIMKEESGKTFAERMKEQALSAGVEIRYENVTETKLIGNIKKIVTDKESYECKTVILANGGSGRMLGIPGNPRRSLDQNPSADQCPGRSGDSRHSQKQQFCPAGSHSERSHPTRQHRVYPKDQYCSPSLCRNQTG